MIAIITFIGLLLMAYAAYADMKYREYELAAFIFMIIISFALFILKQQFTYYDTMAIVIFMIISLILIYLKKVGEGDLAIILLFVIAPFNAAMALLISSFLSAFAQYLKWFKTIPFITIVFMVFVLISIQYYINTETAFYHICLDLNDNTETFKCTFLALQIAEPEESSVSEAIPEIGFNT